MINERNIEFLTLVGEIVDKFSSFNEEEISILIKLKRERYQKILKSLDVEEIGKNSFKIQVSNVELLFLAYE